MELAPAPGPLADGAADVGCEGLMVVYEKPLQGESLVDSAMLSPLAYHFSQGCGGAIDDCAAS